MNGSFPQLTNNDATTMSFFAPTLFWFMNHNFKCVGCSCVGVGAGALQSILQWRTFRFATITRPLTGAVIEMPEGDFEGEETMELDIGVAMAQPHVAGNLAPEVRCVTPSGPAFLTASLVSSRHAWYGVASHSSVSRSTMPRTCAGRSLKTFPSQVSVLAPTISRCKCGHTTDITTERRRRSTSCCAVRPTRVTCVPYKLRSPCRSLPSSPLWMTQFPVTSATRF